MTRTPRYTIEQLFATRTIGDTDWSPDGSQIVVATNISGRNNLWLVPASGGWPTQLTVSDERQESPAWQPGDGRYVAFESDRDADEQWDIFLVDVRTGEVTNLTNTPHVSEEGPLWSPDGAALAYMVKPEDAPNYELALFDMRTRTARALTRGTPPELSYAPCAFHGEWLLACLSAASGKDSNAVLVHMTSGEVVNVTPHEGEQNWAPVDITPDGRYVLVTSDALNGSDNIALLDLPATLAALRAGHAAPPVTWATHGEWEMSADGFSRDGRLALYEANIDGNGELFAYDIASGETHAITHNSGYANFGGHASCFDASGARLLYHRSAADSPGDVFVLDRASGARTQLTHAFVAGVDAAHMVHPSLVHYGSRDGARISAFLYEPRERTGAALVWVHGGPASQSVNGFNRVVQYFVNRGYAVLAPNYRGSTGYGKTFLDANRFDYGGGDLADVVAGARFLSDGGYADARRIAVGGGSYGGYLTMCALTKTPDVWAAGVAMFPFVNWFTELENEDPLLRQYDLQNMGDPEDPVARDRYRDRSPVFFLDAIRAPLMLVAGRNDPRCPPDESQQVHDALAARGTPCEFLLYEDEGHGFARRENMFDAYRRIAAFLDASLGVTS